jgi:DNA-directed RNA polymerase
MRQRIIASLSYRINTEIAPQNPVKFLSKLNLEEVYNLTIPIIYLYTRIKDKSKQIYMNELVSAIGHTIRSSFSLKRDSALAAKAGAFILYTFEECGILRVALGASRGKHASYVIEVLHDEHIVKMWEGIAVEKTEKLPSLAPYAPWIHSKHESGANIVKTRSRDVLDSLTAEKFPIVFEAVNRAQEVGWCINESVYNLVNWALRNKTDAFADIWEMQNPEAKQSKLREAKTIANMARRFLNTVFYHMYYLDFRGRKYPATAYLHEQGSDLAKGLLLRADSKPITEQGFFWLMISIANNWAGSSGREDGAKTDKIPLNERVYWALDNEEILISYAENPKVNQGWMEADKPWQFLAACIELKRFRDWQALHKAAIQEGSLDAFAYSSSLEVYIDGSNNGSQHLSALTRDEITAPHVNLVPSDLPGDLYLYVAEHVWSDINKKVSELRPEEVKECEDVIHTLTALKTQINEAAMKSERRSELIEELRKFRKDNEKTISKAALVFWYHVSDKKHQRKVVKRNVMTLPYGGTPYGLGQQQIDDARKHGIDSLNTMEHKWGSFMGREVFEDCKESLSRPMRLLSIFEEAGKKAEAEGRFLSWNVPITNFPVVQHYTEGITKRVYVQYGPPTGIRLSTGYYENTLQLHICMLEDQKPSKYKQSQGASPNAIHSLDAAHLMIAVHNCSFPVTTVHDSFGCLLADMSDLFVIIRESFVELYKSDPLKSLMEQINGNISDVEIGSLDISLILDSEYAFA